MLITMIIAAVGDTVANKCNMTARLLGGITMYFIQHNQLVHDSVKVVGGTVSIPASEWNGGALSSAHEWLMFTTEDDMQYHVDITAAQYKDVCVPYTSDPREVLQMIDVAEQPLDIDSKCGKVQDVLARFKNQSLHREASMIKAIFKKLGVNV